MRKHKGNCNSNPDPYEDSLRLEKLDAYETQIKLNLPIKLKKNLLNKYFIPIN